MKLRIMHRSQTRDRGLGGSAATSPAHRPSPKGTPIALAPEHAALLEPLAQSLGPAVSLVLGGPDDGDVVILGGVAPAEIAGLQRTRPGVRFLVLEPWGQGEHSSSAVAFLDAGADDYLASSNTVEIAARVQALLRRRRLTLCSS